MEFNDILQQGAKAFKSRLDLNGDGTVDISEVGTAMKMLLSDESGEINLASIVDKMKSSGLVSMAESWLGDGANDPVRGNQLTEIFGKDKIAAFAQKLGIREVSALNGLIDSLPKVIDKSSAGGSLLEMGSKLLESMGGTAAVAGVVDLAKKALASDAPAEPTNPTDETASAPKA